jgi:hypothetical protein
VKPVWPELLLASHLQAFRTRSVDPTRLPDGTPQRTWYAAMMPYLPVVAARVAA